MKRKLWNLLLDMLVGSIAASLACSFIYLLYYIDKTWQIGDWLVSITEYICYTLFGTALVYLLGNGIRAMYKERKSEDNGYEQEHTQQATEEE